MWGRWPPYKRTKNSRANRWKRSHNILTLVPSAQVHVVDGGHFSLDTAPDEIAARVREFMDMPKESVQGEEIMATATTPARPPFPPFTRESAMQKVRLAEDGWNTRDPAKVALAYAIDSRWRNRSEFINGRDEAIAFLSRKWAKSLGVHMFRFVATILVAILLSAPLVAGITPFPASFHTQVVPTNGTSLYVRVGGKGPAVVLLHGFGDTGDMWAPLAIILAKDHTVIVPDLRGMGMSDHPDTGYTKKNQAVDIAGVMDALKVQKADLVTHDIGNMVGYALAAQYPARVTRWVVIDAPLPGIGDWDNITRSPMLWHFNFRGPDEDVWCRAGSASTSIASGTSCPETPRGSMKIRGSTMLPCTHGRMRCTMPSSSLEHSARTPPATRRCSPREARSQCRCLPSVPRSFSARVWPTRCGSPPATSRAASCPIPGTGSWRRIHRPPSSWLQISSPSRLGLQTI